MSGVINADTNFTAERVTLAAKNPQELPRPHRTAILPQWLLVEADK